MAKGKNKFKYVSPLKKQVKKQIKQLGKDGELSKKDVRKISKTSGGGFSNKKINKMIANLGTKKDFDITKKAPKLISKFNVNKNPLSLYGDLKWTAPFEGSGNIVEGISSPKAIQESNLQNQVGELTNSIADYEQKFLDQETDFEKRLMDMRETLTAQMNPQRRNPIFGVRNKRLSGKANSTANSFGRGGGRISGIKNTSLNVT